MRASGGTRSDQLLRRLSPPCIDPLCGRRLGKRAGVPGQTLAAALPVAGHPVRLRAFPARDGAQHGSPSNAGESAETACTAGFPGARCHPAHSDFAAPTRASSADTCCTARAACRAAQCGCEQPGPLFMGPDRRRHLAVNLQPFSVVFGNCPRSALVSQHLPNLRAIGLRGQAHHRAWRREQPFAVCFQSPG